MSVVLSNRSFIILLFSAVFLVSCNDTDRNPDALFTSLNPKSIGVDFENNLEYTEEFNAYTYRNFYNGGGVGIGDINNDGLPDIFFSGNMEDNALYLNKGNWEFENITESAGVASKGVWSTGISLVDINGDGFLDIYICKSGNPEGKLRYNELFINNGDLTFTEQSEKYRVNDKGLATHAAFFDYDKDGDLDFYLLNNSFRSVGAYDFRPGLRDIRDSLGGNKLYRNETVNQDGNAGEYFTDVSEQAGIYGSAIGFGLGVTIGDINRDGWSDIFVSNDFFERDYMYINNQDGTFSEKIMDLMPELSLGSMGADMADVNNDGFPEIFVTEMLPEGDARMKTTTTFENWDKYQLYERNGYHRQFTRNVLQLNNGFSPVSEDVFFSEIGRYSGVYATDWSWGALIADFDNDGLKDLFVANGIYKDLNDQDYINYFSDPETVRRALSKDGGGITSLIDQIPSERIPNYFFHNQGNLKFINKAGEWGLGEVSHSNGSAYGDLDNDGDLDLVVSNVNMAPFIFRNNSESLGNQFLKVSLKGTGENSKAIGAQVTVYAGGELYYQELNPMRGFQSNVDYTLNFGLGQNIQADSVVVDWPDEQRSIQKNVAANSNLVFVQSEAITISKDLVTLSEAYFSFVDTTAFGSMVHMENPFVDFDRDRLIYFMNSTQGPCLEVGDLNGDGREDLFFGGAKNQPSTVWYQNSNGKFDLGASFDKEKSSEDVDAELFDADGDGDLDIYIAGGGSEFSSSSPALKDRLYFNDGEGLFSLSPQILPTGKFEVSSTVKVNDFDSDGDLDLFVGLRMFPGIYGVPANGYLLENNGKGEFNDITTSLAPQLLKNGMYTDASWIDVDNDGDQDLITVGDWMPIQIHYNDEGVFTRFTEVENTSGLWKTIKISDLDNDGDLDFIAGNYGENTRLKSSPEHPLQLYINDFDRNGTAEHILTAYNQNGDYPVALRPDIVMQMPELKKKYLSYKDYKEQEIQDIFTPAQLENAIRLESVLQSSVVGLNDGKGNFELKVLPVTAQLSPVFDILCKDINKDNIPDLIIGGNFFEAKPEIGINAASYGAMLIGQGDGTFEEVKPSESGIFVQGAIRSIKEVEINNRRHIIFARNNDHVLLFKQNEESAED